MTEDVMVRGGVVTRWWCRPDEQNLRMRSAAHVQVGGQRFPAVVGMRDVTAMVPAVDADYTLILDGAPWRAGRLIPAETAAIEED